MRSIRTFLLYSLALSLVLVMSIAAIYAYLTTCHEIDEVFDAQLAQYTRLIAAYNQSQPAYRVLEQEGLLETGIAHKYENKISFQIWHASKTLTARSASAPVEALAPFNEGFHRIMLDNTPWQVFVLHDPASRQWYMAAESLDIREELVAAVARTVIFPLVAGALLALVLIRWILRRGLAPLSVIADAITRRSPGDIRPLQIPAVPTEVQVLVDNIDSLLARVRASLERERRFSADAAHEIKTPLAALKLHLANLEYALAAGDRSPDTGKQELARARQSCDQMQRLLEQLLYFNRLEPDYFSRNLQQVALLPLCREVLADEAEFALAKQQEVQLDTTNDSLEVRSDPAALAMLLRNLLHNAIVYTQTGGRISLRLAQEGGNALVAICDNGPGIPAAERERVFDRFYRVGGDSHASGVSGSGLGLAIAREIVRLHGGQIELQDADGSQGLCVQVRLPLSS